MSSNFRQICSLFIVIPIGVIAGCGGGGGESPGTGTATVVVPQNTRVEAASASSDISQNNFAAFAGPLARVVLSSTGDSLIGTTVGGGSASPSAFNQKVSAASLNGALAHALNVGSAGVRASPLAFSSSTSACPHGGSLTVTANDADGNGKLSAGDTVSLSATHCILDVLRPPANGGFSLTLVAVELDASDDATALDAIGNFADFSVGTVARLNGPFHFWVKQTGPNDKSLRLSYNNVSSSFDTGTVAYNVDVYVVTTATDTTYAISGSVNVAGQAYKVSQGSALLSVLDSDAPRSGVLQLADAAGDTLRLTAGSGSSVDFTFLPSGSSTPTASLLAQTWSSFKVAP